eukprot:scaffold26701_cov77-Skeletonema_dohrnii-CCMP3373.AAC.4
MNGHQCHHWYPSTCLGGFLGAYAHVYGDDISFSERQLRAERFESCPWLEALYSREKRINAVVSSAIPHS